MRVAENWIDYQLIATNNGEKLERWGKYYLLRPDPQILWKTGKALENFEKLNARYIRSNTGGGSWDIKGKMADEWVIGWKDLKFKLKLMGFKHTGLFPEQAYNWQIMMDLIKNAKKSVKVLNLFAYTGGATLACARAGAAVTHVDASKGMVQRAKENLTLSGLDNANVRTIIDDCEKFILREIKRGNKYDAIIMDPPSYGRGPAGEVWKIEDKIFDLVNLSEKVLDKKPLFVLINSYTTGLSAGVVKNIASLAFKNLFDTYDAYELGIKSDEGIILPCGSSCMAFNKK